MYPKSLYKALVWIVILVTILSLASLACDKGGGCKHREPVTGVCVDSSVSNPNWINDAAKTDKGCSDINIYGNKCK